MNAEQQANWNNNPVNQPVDEDAIKNSDPKGKPSGNPNAVPHKALDQGDKFKNSGKDIGLVNAPVVSLNPTSGDQAEPSNEKDYQIFDNPNRYLNFKSEQQKFKYPFDKMDVDQGIFIPVEKGDTTDNLVARLHKDIDAFRKQTSEVEKDENGDDVRESVVIETKKRKDDVIQLDGAGKPIVGANQTNRYKLIYSANFIVRPVVKGDALELGEGSPEAESDGALLIRVM